MICRLTLYTQDLAVRIMRISQYHYPARNCCRHVADVAKLLHLWGRGGMVDTLVLGTSLVRGGSSSLLDPTNFLRMSFKNIGSVLLMCVDAIKVWGNLLELPNSFLKDLGSR